MSEIRIRNLGNLLLSSKDNSKSILNIIHENGIDWMFACGGKGKCTTCKIIVKEGLDNISEITPTETKFRELKRLTDNERLACQSKLNGDIEIEVAEANKFPHMNYSY